MYESFFSSQLKIQPLIFGRSHCAGWEIKAVKIKIPIWAPSAILDLTRGGFYPLHRFRKPKYWSKLPNLREICQSAAELLRI